MELAKSQGVTVLLDGQGADEIFGGYLNYIRSYARELRANKASNYPNELQAFAERQGVDLRGKKAQLMLHYPEVFDRVVKWKSKLRTSIDAAFSPTFQQRLRNAEQQTYPHFNRLNGALNYDLRKALLPNLLRYCDRNSMAHSIEVRLPYLNHELVEFAYSLPATLKIHDGWPKYLLRQAYSDKLPQKVAWREGKIGYEAPQDRWLKTPAMQATLETARTSLVKAEVLKKDQVNLFDPWRSLVLGKMIQQDQILF